MQFLLEVLLKWNGNNVDPDQTAPSGAVWSGSALFVYTILSETWVYKILGHYHTSKAIVGRDIFSATNLYLYNMDHNT